MTPPRPRLAASPHPPTSWCGRFQRPGACERHQSGQYLYSRPIRTGPSRAMFVNSEPLPFCLATGSDCVISFSPSLPRVVRATTYTIQYFLILLSGLVVVSAATSCPPAPDVVPLYGRLGRIGSGWLGGGWVGGCVVPEHEREKRRHIQRCNAAVWHVRIVRANYAPGSASKYVCRISSSGLVQFRLEQITQSSV